MGMSVEGCPSQPGCTVASDSRSGSVSVGNERRESLGPERSPPSQATIAMPSEGRSDSGARADPLSPKGPGSRGSCALVAHASGAYPSAASLGLVVTIVQPSLGAKTGSSEPPKHPDTIPTLRIRASDRSVLTKGRATLPIRLAEAPGVQAEDATSAVRKLQRRFSEPYRSGPGVRR